MTASIAAIFSVAWRGPVPACSGRFQAEFSSSKLFASTGSGESATHANSSFSFVQISDSHIGFNKAANQDVTGTLRLAIDKINHLPEAPDLLLHTGDITQSSKAGEFDTAQQIIKTARAGAILYVPGEHDTAIDDGAMYRERFGKRNRRQWMVQLQPQRSSFCGAQ